MAKFSAGRLKRRGPSRRRFLFKKRPRKRLQIEAVKRQLRQVAEWQNAVIEEVGDEELEDDDDDDDLPTLQNFQQQHEDDDDDDDDDDDGESSQESEEHGEMTDGVGRNGSVSVTLTDPDVLDCFICFDPLTIPVFQCENGHVACSSCCLRPGNRCPSCCSPIGYNRCRAIEKVLESIKVQCKNYKFGCKETMSYSQRHDHEKTCFHAPCSCPLSDCSFVSSSNQLYHHFIGKHKSSAMQFQYSKVSHITVNINEQFLVLQEEIDNVLFILHNRTETVGHVISLSCIAPSFKGGCFYDILARNDRSTVRLQSYTNSIEGKANRPSPPVQGSLLLPSSFFNSQGQLKLDLCIWRYGMSPKLIQKIIV